MPKAGSGVPLLLCGLPAGVHQKSRGDRRCLRPRAMNGEADSASSNYWSSTSNVSNPNNAWNVNFNNGNDNWNNKDNDNYVRCVRGGE